MRSGAPQSTAPRVVIVQRALRRYREEFYDQLRYSLKEQGIRLRVLHSTPPAGRDPRSDAADIPWAERLPRRDIAIGSKRLVYQPLAQALRTADLIVTEQAADLVLNYRLFARQALGGPRVALWGHGMNFETTNRSRLGEDLKRRFSRRPHWWFAYNERAADVVTELGFPRERITVVRNATDTRALRRALATVTDEDREQLRRRLDLCGANVGLFVGTLVPRKRIDFLFAAADAVRDRVPDFELVVAGSGPSSDEALAHASTRPWVRVLGHTPYQELAPLFSVSKVLLIPGWVGLVVVDSFAAHVPLVTSASGLHPPEVAYIRSGVNGLVVDDGGDPARYADEVVRLLRDEEARQRLVAGCRRESGQYTVEAMVGRFTEGVEAALATPLLRVGQAR